MIQVADARFCTTAVDEKGYPPARRPELAFIGRSNVGKSSMINTLLGRRKLVRVSNTPGRTRSLNFFDVSLKVDGAPVELRFCDLPGYGFAKVSKAERASWRGMISTYLESRRVLKVVVALVDAEVGPTSDDHATLDYLAETAPAILVVATKLDRLPKAKRKPRLSALADLMSVPKEAVVGFSAVEPLGVDEVWSRLVAAL